MLDICIKFGTYIYRVYNDNLTNTITNVLFNIFNIFIKFVIDVCVTIKVFSNRFSIFNTYLKFLNLKKNVQWAVFISKNVIVKENCVHFKNHRK